MMLYVHLKRNNKPCILQETASNVTKNGASRVDYVSVRNESEVNSRSDENKTKPLCIPLSSGNSHNPEN